MIASTLMLDLGDSHVAFENYLEIRHELSLDDCRLALLHCWTMQPGCRRRREWIRELKKVAPLVWPEDSAAFAALPDEVTVHRGADRDEERGLAGLSWTLKPETAEFFARTVPHPIGGSYRPPRRPGAAIVLEGVVEKSHILLFDDDRHEAEIVSDRVRVIHSRVPA